MHELSLSESIIALVTECAGHEGVGRVSRVTVDIGEASAVDPQALQFCFPLLSKGTVAAGAELVINRIPLKVRCADCRAEYRPESPIAPCPACGSHARAVLEGREMRVVSFDGE